jgi:hypothetical protein
MDPRARLGALEKIQTHSPCLRYRTIGLFVCTRMDYHVQGPARKADVYKVCADLENIRFLYHLCRPNKASAPSDIVAVKSLRYDLEGRRFETR